MGMTLLQARTALVRQTGKYHLVVDYEGADYSDNGADFYLNAGQRRIDDIFGFKKDTAWYYKILSAGSSLLQLDSARYVEEVWAVDRSSPRGRRKLEHKTDQWLREEYASVPLSQIESATPAYWANVVVGLPPVNYDDRIMRITGATQANPCVITAVAHGFSNGDTVHIDNVVGMTELNENSYVVAGATADTFQLTATNSTAYTEYESGGIVATTADFAKEEDIDWLVFGNHYLTTGLKIMPPPDTEYSIEVKAKIFSKELTADTDVSFWSWNYPEILILAAMIEIEVMVHVNSERAQALTAMLVDKLKQIYYNVCSEENAGDATEYRMI